MQVNKLLVKSLLESSGWVDRIAADPERERKAKMSNAKSNALQHSKLDFATKAKADDPRISFGNLTTSSATSIYPATKRILAIVSVGQTLYLHSSQLPLSLVTTR